MGRISETFEKDLAGAAEPGPAPTGVPWLDSADDTVLPFESSQPQTDDLLTGRIRQEERTRQQSVQPPAGEKMKPRFSENTEFLRPTPSVDDTSRWDERLITHRSSSSEVAENFRRLRTSIISPLEGSPSRSVLVASVMPGEGRSFTAANLAISIAQGLEQHALLVDCNLRKPALAKMFGLSNTRGLVTYLQQGTDLAELIQKTGMEKLSVLPAGPPPPNPAELLTSAKMGEMLRQVVDRYHDRFIILDAPPMQLASEINILANNVSGVVLVVRWGLAKRQHVRRLVETIGKGKILGILYNGVPSDMLEEKLQNILHV